jgi:hypothetical protein
MTGHGLASSGKHAEPGSTAAHTTAKQNSTSSGGSGNNSGAIFDGTFKLK